MEPNCWKLCIFTLLFFNVVCHYSTSKIQVLQRAMFSDKDWNDTQQWMGRKAWRFQRSEVCLTVKTDMLGRPIDNIHGKLGVWEIPLIRHETLKLITKPVENAQLWIHISLLSNTCMRVYTQVHGRTYVAYPHFLWFHCFPQGKLLFCAQS